MRRFGQVIKLRPEAETEYKRIHEQIPTEIENAIREAGIRNYSIYLKDGYLFAYMEYHGPDDEYEARMARLAQVSRDSGWGDIPEPMQEPLPTRAEGEWWATMEEVFHQD